MKVYKTLKNIASKTPRIAVIGIVATLPYVCESCGYSKNTVNAQEIEKEIEKPSNLEIILEK